MINVILQFLGLDLFNIKLSAKVYQNIPNGLRVKFHFFSESELDKASTNPKCHLTISWATSCQYTNVYAKFHHNIPLSSRDRAIFTFSEFGARQNLDRWKMTFHNRLSYILIISIFTQTSSKIFHSVQELRTFSLFQNLALGKASTDDKCHFAIVSLLSEFEPRQKFNQSQMSFDNFMGYILSISMCMQNFITIFHSAKPRPMKNVNSQSLGLDLVNINIYVTVYQNIPLSLRDRTIFTFSEFGAQQSLDRW